MSTRGSEPTLGVLEFGRALLETLDLDPMYVALHRAGLDPPVLDRWLLAYWCFYHAGTASAVADAPDFWPAMRRAEAEKWPRGPERRHFRGHPSAAAVAWLADRFPRPGAAVESLRAPTFAAVAARARAWPMFGPWIAFKVADMAERVLSWPVDFADCELDLYAEPRAGAALVAARHGLTDSVPEVAAWLADSLGTLRAPPGFDRYINIQEIETILCKWKSHLKGHYPAGKDTGEIRRALGFFPGRTAGRLLAGLPGG